MRYRFTVGTFIFDAVNHIIMIFVCIVMVYPFMHVFALSLSSPSAIDVGMVSWLPRRLDVKGYEFILRFSGIGRAYLNTVLYAAGGAFFTLSFTSMLAYPLSIKEFTPKKFIVIFLSVTMFFGGGLIPTFLVIKMLRLIDTYLVMVLPMCVAAWNVFIFRAFFQNIPAELAESAHMDGANEFVVLFRIILPLSKALLAVFALFTIVGIWNDWFTAFVYLRDWKRQPVQQIVRKILVISNLQELVQRAQDTGLIPERDITLYSKNIQMATVMVVMLPILCIYPFIQKYFVKGIYIGSLKA